MQPDEHFFRRESGRLVAALTRIFGPHNLALAEDVAQDALARALDLWKLRGVPENPSAWLMATAKNRAIDVLRRERTARTFAPELGRLLDSEWTLVPTIEELFDPSAIRDDVLRMMFSCCHPRLPDEGQVALILHILCGFRVNEIASAFLSSADAIEKRLQRSKKVLATSRDLFDLKDVDFDARLSVVQRALYLLFNEGYHGASAHSAVRVELCDEAMRLVLLLVDHPPTATPRTCALAALMSLHAARLPARIDHRGELTPLFEQDRARWDAALVDEGLALLDRSATGEELSEYHIEAAIAAVHANARHPDDTDWSAIIGLYDLSLALRPSPVTALGRAIAIGQHEGPVRGLAALAAIREHERLAQYPFYFAARGDMELRAGRAAVARDHFRAALAVARSPIERRFFERRIRDCDLDRGGDDDAEVDSQGAVHRARR